MQQLNQTATVSAANATIVQSYNDTISNSKAPERNRFRCIFGGIFSTILFYNFLFGNLFHCLLCWNDSFSTFSTIISTTNISKNNNNSTKNNKNHKTITFFTENINVLCSVCALLAIVYDYFSSHIPADASVSVGLYVNR